MKLADKALKLTKAHVWQQIKFQMTVWHFTPVNRIMFHFIPLCLSYRLHPLSFQTCWRWNGWKMKLFNRQILSHLNECFAKMPNFHLILTLTEQFVSLDLILLMSIIVRPYYHSVPAVASIGAHEVAQRTNDFKHCTGFWHWDGQHNQPEWTGWSRFSQNPHTTTILFLPILPPISL